MVIHVKGVMESVVNLLKFKKIISLFLILLLCLSSINYVVYAKGFDDLQEDNQEYYIDNDGQETAIQYKVNDLIALDQPVPVSIGNGLYYEQVVKTSISPRIKSVTYDITHKVYKRDTNKTVVFSVDQKSVFVYEKNDYVYLSSGSFSNEYIISNKSYVNGSNIKILWHRRMQNTRNHISYLQ